MRSNFVKMVHNMKKDTDYDMHVWKVCACENDVMFLSFIDKTKEKRKNKKYVIIAP